MGVLTRKPGALRKGAPFKGGQLPGALGRMRARLTGRDDGDRQSVNILARHRQPLPPLAIPTPEGLQLRHQPVADCRRYDRLRAAGHGAS